MNCCDHLVCERGYGSLPQYFVQRLSLCEFINELVQVAYLPHEWVFNLLHAYSTHNAFYERRIWIEHWRFGKEGLNVALKLYLVLKFCLAIACQPANDLVNFFFRAVLAFGFLNIHRVNAREFHSIYSVLRHWQSFSRSRLRPAGHASANNYCRDKSVYSSTSSRRRKNGTRSRSAVVPRSRSPLVLSTNIEM